MNTYFYAQDWVLGEAGSILDKSKIIILIYFFFLFVISFTWAFQQHHTFLSCYCPRPVFGSGRLFFLLFEISWVFQFYMPQCCWLGVPVFFGFKVLPQSCGYLLYNVWRHILDRFGQKSWMKGWPLMRFYPNWNWGLFARWWEANYLILNFVNS